MDFQNVNFVNVRANLFSGNLLPMVEDESFRSSTGWRLYSAFTWVIELIHTVTLFVGLFIVPREKALLDGTIATVVTVETSFMLTRLYTQKPLIRQVISMMNNILNNADDTMTKTVQSTLQPIKLPFTMYGIASAVSVAVWNMQSLFLVSKKSTFYYVDYKLPVVLSPQPFSTWVMISSTIVISSGCVYLSLKKFSVDVYMIHLVLLLTAQYRCTATKLTELFRSSQDYHDVTRKGQVPVEANRWAGKKLRNLCRHQNTVLQMSFMLKKLLSVNFSLLYLSSVFRFCFIGIMGSTLSSMNLMEAVSVVSFTLGSLTQFFLLCSSVQTLLDASTEITDQAFDEAWYQSEASMKSTFLLLIMANHLECKICAVGKFNLSLPSFMTILNQSYSIALLFLRVK